MTDTRAADLEAEAIARPSAAAVAYAHPYARLALGALLASLAYYGVGIVAQSIRLSPGGVSTLWLPHSVVLATLILTPARLWWVYLAALLPAHLLLTSHFQGGPVSLGVMLIQFGGNAAQSMLGALTVQRLIGAPPRLDAFRHMLVFVVLGVTLPVLVVAAAVAWLFVLTGWVSDFGLTWHRRTLTGVYGALALAPLIIEIASGGIAAIRAAPRRRHLEFAALTLGVLALVLFALRAEGLAGQHALLFAPLPLLVWTAVRFGPGGLSLHLAFVAVATLAATKFGRGPFIASSAAESVLAVTQFLLSVSIPLLLLAALVAERNRSDRTLREREERLQLALATGRMGVWDWDRVHNSDAWSKEYFELMGLAPFDLRPSPDLWASRVHPDDLHRAHAAMADAIAERKQYRCEYRFVCPDGAIRWVEARGEPIYDDAGRCARVMGLAVDISDRKHLEEANEQLAHASRLAAMGELTASIAHEVNQPLSAILNNADAAELLLEKFGSGRLDEVRRILADIRKDDLRASEVIQRTRELLRKHPLEGQPLDVNEMTTGVLRLVSADAARRGVSVDTELARDLPTVHGDRGHLQQVLLNLLLNGMDSMADTPVPERRLTVRTGRSDGSVEIAVMDRGDGIGPGQASRLFDSFFTTKKDGMGLGLSIARSIVEAHGGRIWAENRPEGGATFRFTLPLGRAAWQEGPEPPRRG